MNLSTLNLFISRFSRHLVAHLPVDDTPHLSCLPSLPMFMRDVLHYDLDTSGMLAAFPYILMALVAQVGS